MRLAPCLLAITLLSGCETLNDAGDAGADAAGACAGQTCSASQVCLYRECSEKERCRPSTTCAAGTTPADCDGRPGCLVPASQCAPVAQGCRDVPPSCGGDVTCACQSICGSPAACAKVDGRDVACAGS